MIGIGFWDGERVSDANDVLLRMLGYTRADLEAGLLRSGRLTPPEYGPADAIARAEAQSRGSCAPYEKEFLRKDGSRLKPPMGYEFYKNMTNDDLDAVVAYLRTVPAKE